MRIVDGTVPAVGSGDHPQTGSGAGQVKQPFAGRPAGRPGEPEELAAQSAQGVPADDRSPVRQGTATVANEDEQGDDGPQRSELQGADHAPGQNHAEKEQAGEADDGQLRDGQTEQNAAPAAVGKLHGGCRGLVLAGHDGSRRWERAEGGACCALLEVMTEPLCWPGGGGLKNAAPLGVVGQEPDGGWLGNTQLVGVGELAADGPAGDGGTAGEAEAEGAGPTNGMEDRLPPGADAPAR